MERLWFVTNPGSGTATPEKCAAIEAVFAERGLDLVGRTGFPDEALPTAGDLSAARADTVVLFAGDGTINATLCALAEWGGGFLILPGGTMNLLAKGLHDSLDPHAIIHAAHDRAGKVARPHISAGEARAFVGVILGPAAHWFRAREAARHRHFGRILRAVRHAWGRTFGRGIRVVGVPGLRRGYQAVFAFPDADHGLAVSGIDARDWRSIVELGWTYAIGEWGDATPVEQAHVRQFRLTRRHSVLGLFDGEPVRLAPGTQITSGMSAPIFLETKAA